MYARDQSGTIKYQLGRTLTQIGEAIVARDVQREADLTDDLITLCSPKLEEEEEGKLREIMEEGWATYNGIKRDKWGVGRAALHQASQQTKTKLLRLLSGKGLYSWKDIESGGPDSGLPPLTDDDSGPTEAF